MVEAGRGWAAWAAVAMVTEAEERAAAAALVVRAVGLEVRVAVAACTRH